MDEWLPEVVVPTALALELVREQFPGLGRTIEPIGYGWDNTAYLIDGDIVFRFPRREIAVPLIASKCSLPALAPGCRCRPLPAEDAVPRFWAVRGLCTPLPTATSPSFRPERRAAVSPCCGILRVLTPSRRRLRPPATRTRMDFAGIPLLPTAAALEAPSTSPSGARFAVDVAALSRPRASRCRSTRSRRTPILVDDSEPCLRHHRRGDGTRRPVLDSPWPASSPPRARRPPCASTSHLRAGGGVARLCWLVVSKRPLAFFAPTTGCPASPAGLAAMRNVRRIERDWPYTRITERRHRELSDFSAALRGRCS